MSSRYYPRYVIGNPQRRIFLPNFWMILEPNNVPKPNNYLQFRVPIEMSDVDIKNYLTKIYKLPIVCVKSFAKMGDLRKSKKKKSLETLKDNDYRLAYVQLPVEFNFEYPDLFPKEKLDEKIKFDNKILNQIKTQSQELNEQEQKNRYIPAWFSL